MSPTPQQRAPFYAAWYACSHLRSHSPLCTLMSTRYGALSQTLRPLRIDIYGKRTRTRHRARQTIANISTAPRARPTISVHTGRFTSPVTQPTVRSAKASGEEDASAASPPSRLLEPPAALMHSIALAFLPPSPHHPRKRALSAPSRVTGTHHAPVACPSTSPCAAQSFARAVTPRGGLRTRAASLADRPCASYRPRYALGRPAAIQPTP